MSEIRGKIIKKTVPTRTEGNFAMPESSLIEGEVYDATRVAKELVQKAQAQAEEIVAQANAERDQVNRHARDEGYQEGVAEATEWVAKAKEYYNQNVENARDNLKLLSVKIAEKIIGRSLEMRPEVIHDIVSQAIRTLRQQKNVVVRCNQEDYETLKKNESEFRELMGPSGVITFQADPKISRGGCIVESEIGIVDARLETQLKKLQKLLLSK